MSCPTRRILDLPCSPFIPKALPMGRRSRRCSTGPSAPTVAPRPPTATAIGIAPLDELCLVARVAGVLVGAIRYWPIRLGPRAGPVAGAAGDRAREAEPGYRPGPDRGEPRPGPRAGWRLVFLVGDPGLLRAVRLRGGAGQHRHARREPRSAAVPDPGRRGAARPSGGTLLPARLLAGSSQARSGSRRRACPL